MATLVASTLPKHHEPGLKPMLAKELAKPSQSEKLF